MATNAIRLRVPVRNGRIELPADLLAEHHIEDGDEVEVVLGNDAVQAQPPGRRDLSRFVGILKDTALTKTTDEYMREIRPR